MVKHFMTAYKKAVLMELAAKVVSVAIMLITAVSAVHSVTLPNQIKEICLEVFFYLFSICIWQLGELHHKKQAQIIRKIRQLSSTEKKGAVRQLHVI